jgi:oligopeptide transport system permease protein
MRFGIIKKFFIFIFIFTILLILVLWFSPIKYDDIIADPHLTPSVDHIFGTDYLGRDLFLRVCYAILNTFFIVGFSMFCSLFFGVMYGAYAGYKGGKTEQIMLMILNILDSVPSFLLMIVVLAVLNNFLSEQSSILGVLITLVVISWIYLSRIIINETKKITDYDYVQYAVFKKATFWHIFKFHLLPNLKNIIIIIIIQKTPSFIFIESFLSFVGIGIQPPYPSLGKMISDGIKVFRFYPHELFIPIISIFSIVFIFNFIGEITVNNRKEYV